MVSGGGGAAGTQFEQMVQRLMELDGDSECLLWRHPLLLHAKEPPAQPHTTMPETLHAEAAKLFKVRRRRHAETASVCCTGAGRF